MFCLACGVKIKEGAEFCSGCGKKVTGVKEAKITKIGKGFPLRTILLLLFFLILISGGFVYWKKIGVWPWVFLRIQPGTEKILETKNLPSETQGPLKIQRKLVSLKQVLKQGEKAYGRRVEVVVTNSTDKPLKPGRFVEVIPKEFAQSINDVIFKPQPRLILKEDPEGLFEWEEIPAGGAEKIVYEMYKDITKQDILPSTEEIIEGFKKVINEVKAKIENVPEKPKNYTSIAWIAKMIKEDREEEVLNKEFLVHGVVMKPANLTMFDSLRYNAVMDVFKTVLTSFVKPMPQPAEKVVSEITNISANRPARFLGKDLYAFLGDLRSEDEAYTEIEGNQVKVPAYYLAYNWSLTGSPDIGIGDVFAGKIKVVRGETKGTPYHLHILAGFWSDNPGPNYVSIYELSPRMAEYQKENKKITTIGEVRKIEEKEDAFWVRLYLYGYRTFEEYAQDKNGWSVWVAIPKDFKPTPKEMLVLTVTGKINKANFDLPTEDDSRNRFYLEARDLTPVTPVIPEAAKFAKFEETAVNVTPKISDYKVEEDLSNVMNKEDFSFSDDQKKLLAKNAFVVKPGTGREFFELYESNRYSQRPSFITTDSILHNYHLMFSRLLRDLEQQQLAGELKALNVEMLFSALEQYNSLRGRNSEWENAAKRNAGFFTVGSKLLDPDVQIPEGVKDEVEKELALIEAHQGVQISPLMNIGNPNPEPLTAFKEDYSQYIPRGHYEKTDLLKRYFKSMMWYGRMSFRLKNEDEVKSAMMITLALNKEKSRQSWEKIYEPTNFFVGKSDDITFYQFKDLLEKTYGGQPNLQTIIDDKSKFASFVELTKKLEPPQINSMPIFKTQERTEEIKGFRFMGQRFTVDASIFQRLVDSETPKRMLPKGLDIPAGMGSNEALNILKSTGETNFENYEDNMAKMKEYTGGLKTDIWTQNLYWSWLYSLQPLTQEKPTGYPTFMRNAAWLRKDLNTYLGNWTELKHDTILYAKQVYAELGGGPMEEKDDRGYVEPNVYVYGRLAGLLKMTREGLKSRNLLSDKNRETLEKMEQLVSALKTISEKELNGETLTNEEYDLIRSYGGQLETFWIEAVKDEGSGQGKEMIEEPAALVADVATDPNGQVLEEATGYISDIFGVVPIEGKLRIAKGGVYSYYEFTWPLSDRLTDSKWRQMLQDNKAPELPEWTKEFVAK